MRFSGEARAGGRLVVVASVAMGLLLAGCGSDNKETSAPAPSSTAAPAGSPTTAAPAYQPVTITDCTGTQSTFTAPPTRVANLTRATLELLFWLGVEDSITGTQPPPPGALPSQFDAAGQALTSLSGPYKPNNFKPVPKEALLAANPDFVIGGFTSNFDTAGATTQKELTDRKVNSYFAFSTACTSALSGPQANLDLVYKDLQNLGAIFGVQAKATELISQMRQRVAAVHAKVDSLPDKPSVFVFEFEEGTDELSTAGNRQTVNAVITEAGGRNIFGDVDKAFNTTGWEEVISRNPDAILITVTGGPTAQTDETLAKAKEFLLGFEPIQNLPVVQNQRFFGLIDGFGAIGGYRNAEGVEMVAKALHPDAFR